MHDSDQRYLFHVGRLQEACKSLADPGYEAYLNERFKRLMQEAQRGTLSYVFFGIGHFDPVTNYLIAELKEILTRQRTNLSVTCNEQVEEITDNMDDFTGPVVCILFKTSDITEGGSCPEVYVFPKKRTS